MTIIFNDPALFKRELDIGAYGLLIPLVNSRQKTIDAVSYCKYSPEGVRGIAPPRAGRLDPLYVETANDEVIVCHSTDRNS